MIIASGPFQELDEMRIQCNICPHNCVLKNGETGLCKEKINIENSLYTLNFREITIAEPRPIEQTPFFEFYQETTALNLGGYSCNFWCPFCLNYEISYNTSSDLRSKTFSNNDILKLVKETNSKGVVFTFNEPAIMHETVIDIFSFIKRVDSSIYTAIHSNGFMSKKVIDLIIKYTDGFVFDIKGDDSFYLQMSATFDSIWNNIRKINNKKRHLELVIPLFTEFMNDNTITKIMNKLINDNINCPIIILKGRPITKYNNFTQVSQKKAEDIVKLFKENGFHESYLMGFPGSKYESSYCKKCGKITLYRYDAVPMFREDIDYCKCK
ncbi:MAG: radical SAM protein [Candidatus Heimdallarchaeum endolithica]|uniref:Radical SAM protein n=1 Tax=Candidatus Heimdallarchaeum endolithica TaxID=2876572 RepID=A0A9Y1BSL0_9ARCH|nr:MAG: radical SAM protein [Candidatus Heimdallarchaeum endolithica]